MTGINIQTPWSNMLINGVKTVETRKYPLPQKYVGETLALIETPGKSRSFKSRIIGTIVFSHSFKYPDEQCWKNDYNRHRVSESCHFYNWDDKPKYGWVVSQVTKFDKPVDIRKRKGIIFTTGVNV